MESFRIASHFDPKEKVVLFEKDCRDLLKTLPSKSVQLVVTSPPYNLGKEYEQRIELNEYIGQQREIIHECHRVLNDSVSICLQVGNFVQNGSIIPIDALLYPIFADLGMKMRNRIVWHFEHGKFFIV